MKKTKTAVIHALPLLSRGGGGGRPSSCTSSLVPHYRLLCQLTEGIVISTFRKKKKLPQFAVYLGKGFHCLR